MAAPDHDVIPVRVPVPLMEQYRALADERDCSVGVLIRQAMEAYRPPATDRRAGILLIPSEYGPVDDDEPTGAQLVAALADDVDHDLTPTILRCPGRYVRQVRCQGAKIIIPARMALDPAVDLDALRQAGEVRVERADGWQLDEFLGYYAARSPADELEPGR